VEKIQSFLDIAVLAIIYAGYSLWLFFTDNLIYIIGFFTIGVFMYYQFRNPINKRK